MQVLKCGELGSLNYRLPNIPEAMRLLKAIGIKASDIENGEFDELEMAAKLFENLGPFVSDINIMINEEKIETYEGLLNHFCMIKYLNVVVEKIMKAVSMDEKKKD